MPSARPIHLAGALLSAATAVGVLWGTPLAGLAMFAQWRGGNVLSASGPESPTAVAAWAATVALSLLIALAAAAAGSAVVLWRGPSQPGWSTVRRCAVLVATATNLLVGLAMAAGAVSGELHPGALGPAVVWSLISMVVTALAVHRVGVHGSTPVRVATVMVLALPLAGTIGLIAS